jgi:hypothetical protein
MYAMTTIKAIRDEFFPNGKTISEIGREQKVDRKTVRKFIEEIIGLVHRSSHNMAHSPDAFSELALLRWRK